MSKRLKNLKRILYSAMDLLDFSTFLTLWTLPRRPLWPLRPLRPFRPLPLPLTPSTLLTFSTFLTLNFLLLTCTFLSQQCILEFPAARFVGKVMSGFTSPFFSWHQSNGWIYLSFAFERKFFENWITASTVRKVCWSGGPCKNNFFESLILAQNERWRRA